MRANLIERNRELFRRGGDGLHALRRAVAYRRDVGRNLAGAVGDRYHLRSFQFHGFRPFGRRGNDRFDGPLEGIGKGLQHRALFRFRALFACRLLVLEASDAQRVFLEDLHRHGHLPDLVAALDPGNGDLVIAGCKSTHGSAQVSHRHGDAAGNGDTDKGCDTESRQRQGEGPAPALVRG